VNAFKVLELDARAGKPIEAEVQTITLGSDLAIVGLPGEIFVDLGKAIKAASKYKTTIVVELANGSIGYVPDRKAYPEGAYEVISSRVAEGGGERLVEAALRLLQQK
jgi:neutral ceramidase